MEWTCATSSAGWSARRTHASVFFDNKMWVLGGYDYPGYHRAWNDVWYSIDGSSWTCATESAGWSGRWEQTAVAFDNKIWILGGMDVNGNLRNDVWYSTDGVNWTQATPSAGWPGRSGHTSVVFDNKIWVLGGGQYNSPYRSDVWYSTDGVNWTQATPSAGWSARWGHTSFVFDNKIWVLGGLDGNQRNDVWYSTDGIYWTNVISSAGWSARWGHTSVIFDNKMWVLGGFDGTRRNDVWFSIDGVRWTQATPAAGWSQRYGHTTVAFDNLIWLLGGDNDPYYYNDVWFSSGLWIGESKIATPSARNDFVVFPNPAKTVMRVRCPLSVKDKTELKIFDVSGKMIREIASPPKSDRNDGEIRISLKGINPGIYFLRFGTDVKKFLVVK
jgi:hypothetical protein